MGSSRDTRACRQIAFDGRRNVLDDTDRQPLGLILPRLIPANDPAIPLQLSTRWLVGVHLTLVIACPHLEGLLPVVLDTDKPYIVHGGRRQCFLSG